MTKRLLLEGPEIEDLLAQVRDDYGEGARIVSADRVRSGGVAGFFAKQRYELTVEIDDEPQGGRPQNNVQDFSTELQNAAAGSQGNGGPGAGAENGTGARSVEDLVALANAYDRDTAPPAESEEAMRAAAEKAARESAAAQAVAEAADRDAALSEAARTAVAREAARDAVLDAATRDAAARDAAAREAAVREAAVREAVREAAAREAVARAARESAAARAAAERNLAEPVDADIREEPPVLPLFQPAVVNSASADEPQPQDEEPSPDGVPFTPAAGFDQVLAALRRDIAEQEAVRHPDEEPDQAAVAAPAVRAAPDAYSEAEQAAAVPAPGPAPAAAVGQAPVARQQSAPPFVPPRVPTPEQAPPAQRTQPPAPPPDPPPPAPPPVSAPPPPAPPPPSPAPPAVQTPAAQPPAAQPPAAQPPAPPSPAPQGQTMPPSPQVPPVPPVPEASPQQEAAVEPPPVQQVQPPQVPPMSPEAAAAAAAAYAQFAGQQAPQIPGYGAQEAYGAQEVYGAYRQPPPVPMAVQPPSAATPATPGPPGVPGLPTTPGAPGAPGVPGIPGVPGVPGAQGPPSAPGAYSAYGAYGAYGAQGVPQPPPMPAHTEPDPVQAGLLALGVPAALVARVAGHDPYTAILHAFESLPPTPWPPSRPGDVLVIAGPPDVGIDVAGRIARAEQLNPQEILLAAGSTAGTGLHPSRRITGPADAQRRARKLHRADTPHLVVVATSAADEDNGDWVRAIGDALGAAAVWAVVDATRKTADTLRHLETLGPLHGLIVHGAGRTADPGTVLHLGVPVVYLDGRRVSPARWAGLLCERLEGGAA